MRNPVETFLEQIILKQVKGSVYLIPAITDVQVNKLKKDFEQVVIDTFYEGKDAGAGLTNIEDLNKSGEEYFKETFEL